ncbi:DsbA family protein [archaeon]|jgi:protein-disulfide isomerase|nr:DsbA family protein [archaeon]
MSNKTITFKKDTLMYVVIAILVIALILVIFAGGTKSNSETIKDMAKNGAKPSVNMNALIDDDSIKGNPDAPVTIVEFSDYECPFCERFYSQTFGQIKSEYIDTGKVNFVYRDFPLGFHTNAQKAAEAAECAGEQGQYFDMHDKLFELGVDGGTTSFKQYAKDIGLNTDEFATCLDSGQMAKEVKADMSAGQKLGVQGTPAFFINGEFISGAQPFNVFEQAIEAALN